jgi:DNA-binding NtrC family response regulator
MASPLRLSAAEREFFGLVSAAVFTNPFAGERRDLDARIAGVSGGKPVELPRVLEAVEARLSKLEAAGRADLRRYRGRDQEILSYAFLFDVYYRFRDGFVAVIEAQIAAGDEPCAAPFAPQAIAALLRRGFERSVAVQHFAVFYQIRRAFYFIERALIGKSPAMERLRRDLWNNIFTADLRSYGAYLLERMEDFSTLLLGETGTGKGSAAAAIGRSGFIPFNERSGRFVESFTRAFVPLNLSEFPETLIESELFGHRKGAFTGAVESYEGVLAHCSPHGSIFLDEIGEIGVPVQIKLLKVLEERSFAPVGGHERRRFRGRVIAATNRRLEELRGPAGLREDFFYRLCSDIIEVPPLRRRLAENPGELEELIRHTLRRLLGPEAGGIEELAAGMRRTIDAQLGPGYPWPGNVRELAQCVRRIQLKGRYEGDRPSREASPPEGWLRRAAAGSLDARELVAAYCRALHERHRSYEEVARRTRLDRRTVKKYIEQAAD